MGSSSSVGEACLVWCGDKDDAYLDPPVLGDEDTTMSLTEDLVPRGEVDVNRKKLDESGVIRQQGLAHSKNLLALSSHEGLCPADKLAPSTCGSLRKGGGVKPRDALLFRHGLSNPKKENRGHGAEDGVRDGLPSFFYSEGDELVEDMSWSRTKRGPTLAELLRRVEHLGNVDLALSEMRGLQKKEDQEEAKIRTTVLERFLLVMGSEGPGLAVKKCHRNRNFVTGVAESGKWAARTIRFETNGFEGQPDGTPLGGFITWNSQRSFPREQRGVSIADITKAEHNGKCVWVTTAEGKERLGFETSSDLNARFLCRSIDFLISATIQHDHGSGRDGSKTSSIRSSGTDNDTYGALVSDGLPSGV